MEKAELGRHVIDLNDSAAIIVEQIDDEIAGVIGVHLQITADQALKLSRALAEAAANAGNEAVAE